MVTVATEATDKIIAAVFMILITRNRLFSVLMVISTKHRMKQYSSGLTSLPISDKVVPCNSPIVAPKHNRTVNDRRRTNVDIFTRSKAINRITM